MVVQQQTCADCPPGPSNSTQTSSISPQPDQSIPSTAEGTFSPPSPESLQPSITIEFCDRCRWAPRATWTQTELFLTFPVPIIRSITLQPLTSPETGGRFRVWVFINNETHLVWDRKTEGGFPELKVLKQRIRNILQPDLSLGHSDVHSTKSPSVNLKSGPPSVEQDPPAATPPQVNPDSAVTSSSTVAGPTTGSTISSGGSNEASERAIMIFQKLKEQNAALLAEQGVDAEVKKLIDKSLANKATPEDLFKVMGLRTG